MPLAVTRKGRFDNCDLDRNIHIRCYRKAYSIAMAHQKEEHEHRDLEMGIVWCSCMLELPHYLTTPPLRIVSQQTIKFINDEASSVHGALRVSSLYTSESGEWKVGGFEVLSSMKNDDAIIYVGGSSIVRMYPMLKIPRIMEVLFQMLADTHLPNSQSLAGMPSSETL